MPKLWLLMGEWGVGVNVCGGGGGKFKDMLKFATHLRQNMQVCSKRTILGWGPPRPQLDLEATFWATSGRHNLACGQKQNGLASLKVVEQTRSIDFSALQIRPSALSNNCWPQQNVRGPLVFANSAMTSGESLFLLTNSPARHQFVAKSPLFSLGLPFPSGTKRAFV